MCFIIFLSPAPLADLMPLTACIREAATAKQYGSMLIRRGLVSKGETPNDHVLSCCTRDAWRANIFVNQFPMAWSFVALYSVVPA